MEAQAATVLDGLELAAHFRWPLAAFCILHSPRPPTCTSPETARPAQRQKPPRGPSGGQHLTVRDWRQGANRTAQ
jgi:hypothetical protein